MPRRGSLQVWGGVECTLARVGDDVRNETAETGHDVREDDLDRIAALGIRTLRYPVVWESVIPRLGREPDWAWHDRRLAGLRARGLRPIVGLVHHGSGPAGTDLLDPAFPRRLARFAGLVARRYPWLDAFTPVNEPLTTARFSCLYGHWYPHRQDEGAFLRALVHQCRGVLLAMRAIRKVNPAAELVQTEDLGRVFSTPALAYQADYENKRRWLSFDLLFGRVDRHHPWWDRFRAAGVGERDLRGFLAGEGRPDIVGVNHYLTSERFLDERTDLYPAHLAGGNGRHRYADVEAHRVALRPGSLGPQPRLREIWERYATPVVVTEVHHGCTRDEQLRWLREVWRAASRLRGAGADIRAVTVWSLFGAMDWNSLLSRRDGIYEPGAFDVRGPQPRPTALAAATRDLARTGRFDHPILDVPGWWMRSGRFHAPRRDKTSWRGAKNARALLVVGPDGPLRRALLAVADARGLAYRLAADGARLCEAANTADRPVWAVVDVSLDEVGASREPGVDQDPRHERGSAPDLPLLLVSSARVFEGQGAGPFDETTPPSPLGATGRRLRDREEQAFAASRRALVVRAGHLFGPWNPDTGGEPLLSLVRAEGRTPPSRDRMSASYLPDLWHVALDLLIDGETGLRHLVNGETSSTDLAQAAAAGAVRDVNPGPNMPAPHPRLATSKGDLMPPLRSALDRFLRDSPAGWRGEAMLFPAAAE